MKPLDVLKQPVDKKAARRLASEIANLLGSKSVANNSKVIIGEAFCPYKVPFHTDAFSCFISVSDSSYCFRATHRKETPAIADCGEFCVSLKREVPHMGLRKQIGLVSNALGIGVFTQEWTPEAEVERYLMQDHILLAFRRLDFAAFDELFVSQMMLSSKGALQSADHCAEQVCRMRELFELIFRDAWGRRHSA
jgi:hypothetical protein